MKKIVDQQFKNQRVNVEGTGFQNCRFTNCHIIYTGGTLPVFASCIFDRCQWVFDGPAENTIQYFALLATQLGPGGLEIIEGVFESIRRGGVGHGILEHTPALR
jgi:hypothetical protein